MDDRYFHSAFIYQGDAPEFIELIAALKNKIDSIQGLTPDIRRIQHSTHTYWTQISTNNKLQQSTFKHISWF